MAATGCLSPAWVAARAFTQSITIDEAASYELFAAADWAVGWYPSSGNHVLNTLLARASVLALGLSEASLRLPAMLGAALGARFVVRRPRLLRQFLLCVARSSGALRAGSRFWSAARSR